MPGCSSPPRQGSERLARLRGRRAPGPCWLLTSVLNAQRVESRGALQPQGLPPADDHRAAAVVPGAPGSQVRGALGTRPCNIQAHTPVQCSPPRSARSPAPSPGDTHLLRRSSPLHPSGRGLGAGPGEETGREEEEAAALARRPPRLLGRARTRAPPGSRGSIRSLSPARLAAGLCRPEPGGAAGTCCPGRRIPQAKVAAAGIAPHAAGDGRAKPQRQTQTLRSKPFIPTGPRSPAPLRSKAALGKRSPARRHVGSGADTATSPGKTQPSRGTGQDAATEPGRRGAEPPGDQRAPSRLPSHGC
ncbi:hypothetical protein KIL84_014745 [Mauremys mutica]|uniref:Uncharacterized protein n=1 Tax=Mauremys mutica TaxID=74926 RepID=A0A9D3XNZ5_9SAUR|nr:hypothetical protein KIL84_014745 [Mauremys mutica]